MESQDLEMKDRLRFVRNFYKYSQEKISGMIAVSRSRWASYESGRVVPPDLVLNAICTNIPVDFAWLKYGVGDPFRSEEEMLSSKIKSILDGENKSAQMLFGALADLDDSEWAIVDKVINKLRGKH
jgi:transcriptional regulator with XRE-family HTH domain